MCGLVEVCEGVVFVDGGRSEEGGVGVSVVC